MGIDLRGDSGVKPCSPTHIDVPSGSMVGEVQETSKFMIAERRPTSRRSGVSASHALGNYGLDKRCWGDPLRSARTRTRERAGTPRYKTYDKARLSSLCSSFSPSHHPQAKPPNILLALLSLRRRPCLPFNIYQSLDVSRSFAMEKEASIEIQQKESVVIGSGGSTKEEAPAAPYFDPVAEKKLRRKIDLCTVPPVALLFLLCFIDRANIGKITCHTYPHPPLGENKKRRRTQSLMQKLVCRKCSSRRLRSRPWAPGSRLQPDPVHVLHILRGVRNPMRSPVQIYRPRLVLAAHDSALWGGHNRYWFLPY